MVIDCHIEAITLYTPLITPRYAIRRYMRDDEGDDADAMPITLLPLRYGMSAIRARLPLMMPMRAWYYLCCRAAAMMLDIVTSALSHWLRYWLLMFIISFERAARALTTHYDAIRATRWLMRAFARWLRAADAYAFRSPCALYARCFFAAAALFSPVWYAFSPPLIISFLFAALRRRYDDSGRLRCHTPALFFCWGLFRRPLFRWYISFTMMPFSGCRYADTPKMPPHIIDDWCWYAMSCCRWWLLRCCCRALILLRWYYWFMRVFTFSIIYMIFLRLCWLLRYAFDYLLILPRHARYATSKRCCWYHYGAPLTLTLSIITPLRFHATRRCTFSLLCHYAIIAIFIAADTLRHWCYCRRDYFHYDYFIFDTIRWYAFDIIICQLRADMILIIFIMRYWCHWWCRRHYIIIHYLLPLMPPLCAIRAARFRADITDALHFRQRRRHAAMLPIHFDAFRARFKIIIIDITLRWCCCADIITRHYLCCDDDVDYFAAARVSAMMLLPLRCCQRARSDITRDMMISLSLFHYAPILRYLLPCCCRCRHADGISDMLPIRATKRRWYRYAADIYARALYYAADIDYWLLLLFID